MILQTLHLRVHVASGDYGGDTVWGEKMKQKYVEISINSFLFVILYYFLFHEINLETQVEVQPGFKVCQIN